MRHAARAVLTLTLVMGAVGCGGRSQTSDASGTPASGARPAFTPVDETAAVFWDRQTTETAELLRTLVDDYNAGRPQDLLPVKLEHVGGYTDIFRKVSASIQARALPAMAVGYQSMTSEYVQAGAVVALDAFVQDPAVGFAPEDLGDFFPVVLETNRYSDFDNAMYSFPFCKSALMMFFNKKVLADAGIEAPPVTWEEFFAQCRQVKEKTGKHAYAVSVDCSTIDGFVYSMGGDVIDGQTTLFDQIASVRVFELFEALAKEELAYQISPGTYDDETALAHNEIAFMFRSSSARTSIQMLMEGDDDRWGMTRIPQADPANPRTVLYGPNICVFNTTPEQQRAAWAFIKYFTSAETGVKWALGTGYLPIRKSAAKDPQMQAFWDEWAYNRAAFDCLEFAKSEPTVAGWQEVRLLVEKAQTEVLTGIKSARQAVLDLKHKADAVLAQQ
ncbi:MAG TPA: extracellular solute-binding protein [Candidatus Hydrogenedentes bacterium]|nr:extracellular solute-binding protein [Candidatus Hydrogenedentota bacterium]HPG69977.1 extracellular solute-binding protein [Candidatus Hydrogenedentota bacterium]